MSIIWKLKTVDWVIYLAVTLARALWEFSESKDYIILFLL